MPHLDRLRRFTHALAVAIGYRDQPTRLHSERVGSLAVRLGKACDLDSKELEVLGIAASFHDIGKLGVPDRVLYKPGRLDAEEKELIERHCLIGEEIMLAVDLDGGASIATAVRHHHERFDGHGYPDGLRGDDIPIQARIIGIADSYDAMAETRAYHRPRSHDEIIGVMSGETGGKHDPQIMECFCRLFGRDGRFPA